MVAGGNVDGELKDGFCPSGKKMEGDDSLRTMECLRGRLQAERAASRVAKEDAEHMGNKLTELENRLSVEIKSRNRAEKRLKSLMRKLESLNLTYISEDSEHSSFLDKSDFSSVSSSIASSSTKEAAEEREPKTLTTNSAKSEIEDNASQITSSNQTHFSSVEDSLVSEEKSNFGEPSEINSSQNSHHPKTDDHSSSSSSDQAQDDCVDNSLALVPVDFPIESRPSNPIIVNASVRDNSLALVPVDFPIESRPSNPITVNASVRDVLDALKHAREKLQLSMESMNMIKVGSK